MQNTVKKIICKNLKTLQVLEIYFIGLGKIVIYTHDNNRTIKGYKYSKATFKDTREFVTFYNERNKSLKISELLSSYENCDDKNSPNYKGKEECQYYEKRV